MFKWFNNLRIGVRIIIGFLVVIAVACAIGIVGIVNLSSVQDAYALDYTSSTDALECVEGISSHFQQIRVNIYGFVLAADTGGDMDYYAERIAQHKVEVDNNINAYNDILDLYDASEVEFELKLLNNVRDAIVAFGSMREQLMNGFKAGTVSKEEFLESFSKGGEAYELATQANDAIDELIRYNLNYAATQIAVNEEKALNSIFLMIAVIVIGVIFAIIFSLVISRGISVPINKVVVAAGQLARGDLDISFDIRSRDETGKLVDAFRDLVDSTREQAFLVEKIADGDLTVDIPIRSEKDLLGRKLSEMVHKINGLLQNIVNAAEQVSAGARQISDSSMALSQGATEQASSIEELTASIEQVSTQTKINAENASKANGMAEQAKNYAVTGNEQMKEMLKAMDEINESSNNINKIIKVIDDIAFQTNILALNAAVEAARAGQHGKGFAVVAEEVRTLAGRSANAAKETTALIEDSIKKSGEGTRIAKETAEALAKIFNEVNAVSGLVGDINNASNEQAAAIAQINQGIMQVSQVVQENSATSEESAAASEELSGQAEILYDLISQFKLKGHEGSRDRNSGLDPEVAKVLDNMPAKAKKDPGTQEREKQKADVPGAKIMLNDMDFGKY
ncbi:MAG TPA: HAMP domain-containing methyl-accepting chemotaxis protein [Clostridia bacterium]